MDIGLAKRVMSVEHEYLHHPGPLFGLFNSFDQGFPPSFADAVSEISSAISDGHLPLSSNLSHDQKSVTLTQIRIASEIAFDAAKDFKKFKHKFCHLCMDQLAAIHLFTQDTDLETAEVSIYSLINSVLRTKERILVRYVRRYVWLLMTAFGLCPASPVNTLYRGFKGNENLVEEYAVGRVICWLQVSSCLSSADAFCQSTLLGASGERTLLSIELMEKSRARCISQYSASSSETEVIFPPNTRHEASSSLSRTNPDIHRTLPQPSPLSY
jgi:hypothetical protein